MLGLSAATATEIPSRKKAANTKTARFMAQVSYGAQTGTLKDAQRPEDIWKCRQCGQDAAEKQRVGSDGDRFWGLTAESSYVRSRSIVAQRQPVVAMSQAHVGVFVDVIAENTH